MFLFVTIASSSLISQEACNFNYYDMEGKQINGYTFYKNLNFAYNLNACYKTDTLVNCYLVKRLHSGKFNTTQYLGVTQLIEQILPDIDFSKPIHISYFDNLSKPECNLGIENSSYYLDIQEEFSDYSYYKILHKDMVIPTGQTMTAHDKDGSFKKAFFADEIACMNELILRPDKRYLLCYGDGCEIYRFDQAYWNNIEEK